MILANKRLYKTLTASNEEKKIQFPLNKTD